MKEGTKKTWGDMTRYLTQCWNCQHNRPHTGSLVMCTLKNTILPPTTDASLCRSFKPFNRVGT